MTNDARDMKDAEGSSSVGSPTGDSMSEVTIVGPIRPAPVAESEVCLRRLGRYELIEEVGRGSFARVYRAWDPKLERIVAIKALRSEYVDDDHMVARVYREARAAAQLRHPAIVPVYEVGEDGGQAFIVTDFVSGGTLGDILEDGPVDGEAAARIVARVADALHYAHQYGVVHRDVKPANIMRDEEGEPVVADFGLAMHVDAEMTLSEGGSIVGTPAYMAPEQARGEGGVDARADVYALGVVLYRMLTGRLPFLGNWTATVHMVMSVEPPAPRSIRQDIPVDLETIIQKSMAKAPSDRYGTAAEFGDDLRRHLDHLPILARRRGVIGRLALWTRRNPVVAATLSVALLVIAAVTAIAFRSVARERDLFLEQRDASNANLYRALVGEARALAQSRETGWWWKVQESLADAARLDVDARDIAELQRLAIETLATSRPCLRVRHELGGHEGAVHSVAAGDAWVVTVAADGLRMWDVSTGALLQGPFGKIAADGLIRDLATSAGGFWSVSDDGSLQHWRVDGKATHRDEVVEVDGPQCVAVSSDGRVAVGCADGRIEVFDAAGGSREILSGRHGKAVTALAFDERSSHRLLSAGEDLVARVHDVDGNVVESASPMIDLPSDVLLSGPWAFVSNLPSYGVLRIDTRNGETLNRRLHDGGVLEIAFDDGGRLVTVGLDGVLRLVSTALDEVAIGRHRAADALSVAAAADGDHIVVGHDDGTAFLWERSRPRACARASHSHRLAWLADTTMAGGRSVSRVEAGRLEEALRLSAPSLNSIAVTDDGCVLTGSGDGRVVLREPDGSIAFQRSDEEGRSTRVAASPDGAYFAYNLGRMVEIVESSTRRVMRSFAVADDIDLIALDEGGRIAVRTLSRVVTTRLDSQDLMTTARGVPLFGSDRLLVVRPDSMTTIFDSGETEELRRETHIVDGVRCGPGSYVTRSASGRVFLAELTGSVTDLPGELLTELPPDVTRVVPDDEAWRAVVTRGDGRTELWDLDQGVAIADLYRVAAADAVFVGGRRAFIATVHGEIRLLDLDAVRADREEALGRDDEQAKTLYVFRRTGTMVAGAHADAIWGVATSSDGKTIATCGHDATTKLWDADDGRLLKTLTGHRSVAWCVAFSSDGRSVFTGSAGCVTVHDVQSGEERARLETHDGKLVSAVTLSHGGRILATAGYDGTVRLHDPETSKEKGVLFRTDTAIHGAAFSPDDRFFAVTVNDGKVLIWDVAALEGFEGGVASPAPRRVIELDSPPWAVGFDATTSRFAVACEDGGVRLWPDVRASSSVLLACGASLLRSVAFSPDGGRLAAGAFASRGVVWDLNHLASRLRALGLPAW